MGFVCFNCLFPPECVKMVMSVALSSWAYLYTVLLFGPSLFAKCVDVALSPLLSYLNDWLVLARSKRELFAHRALLLNNLE